MDVTPLVPKGHQLIEAYGDGGFKITGISHSGSVMVFADRTVAWPMDDFSAVTVESLSPVFEQQGEQRPEILLIGCGNAFGMVPKALREACRVRGITIEAMDTGAACRTHNILMSEGRRVASALIAVA